MLMIRCVLMSLLSGLAALMAGCAAGEAAPSTASDVAKAQFPDRLARDLEPSSEQRATISKLIEQLGNDDFSARDQARQKLRGIGPAANGQLRKAVRVSDDPEIKISAERILQDNETEIWEGYYYYSLDPFEKAVASGAKCVRFWFRVSRTKTGEFTAESDEEDFSLGKADINGTVDLNSGDFKFHKRYNENASNEWDYEGTWNAETGRVEGTYGPGSGGFVLYPRALTEVEKIKVIRK
jgi:hypothetical protein